MTFDDILILANITVKDHVFCSSKTSGKSKGVILSLRWKQRETKHPSSPAVREIHKSRNFNPQPYVTKKRILDTKRVNISNIKNFLKFFFI